MISKRRFLSYVLVPLLVFLLSGCTVIFQKGRRSDIDRIRALEEELASLRGTKGLLEERLADEIGRDQVRLSMQRRGLVITFVDEVLFDSGKAKLRPESFPILDKVSDILQSEVPNNDISIEGHTDNQPIKHSKWKSNWELSAHRALSVLHYLEKNISASRLSASGYGEYRPVASNDSTEGRQLNRRVEVIILPNAAKEIPKQEYGDEPQYEEELK